MSAKQTTSGERTNSSKAAQHDCINVAAIATLESQVDNLKKEICAIPRDLKSTRDDFFAKLQALHDYLEQNYRELMKEIHATNISEALAENAISEFNKALLSLGSQTKQDITDRVHNMVSTLQCSENMQRIMTQSNELKADLETKLKTIPELTTTVATLNASVNTLMKTYSYGSFLYRLGKWAIAAIITLAVAMTSIKTITSYLKTTNESHNQQLQLLNSKLQEIITSRNIAPTTHTASQKP